MDTTEDKTPILTTLDIGIGQLFLYGDAIWVRTDRYVATKLINQGAGSCMFGYIGQNDGEYDNEWNDVLANTVKLNNDRCSELIKASLDYLSVH